MRLRAGRRAAVAAALALLAAAAPVAAAPGPGGPAPVPGQVTRDGGSLRQGQFDEPSLAAGALAAGAVGRLWSQPVQGQVLAQPLPVHDADGRAVLLAVTEADQAYALDPRTGDVLWQRGLGTPEPAAKTGCGDLRPQVGITATPVVDTATATAYVVARDRSDGAVGGWVWRTHALDLRTGAERSGWPVALTGAASNDPTHVLNERVLARAGLLLLGQPPVVYAAMGSFCDNPPYEGWVAGVRTTDRRVTLWTAAAHAGVDGRGLGPGAGIWQSGSGLMSDGDGRVFVATGNDYVPSAPAPEDAPPGALGGALVRLGVTSGGDLTARQFYAPPDVDRRDAYDQDLGSGGPGALPDSMGTATHPHLLVQPSKAGEIVLLDRDHLGGMGQDVDTALDRTPSYGPGFGRAAVWEGDGGWVYLETGAGNEGTQDNGSIRAFRVVPDAAGVPRLVPAGQTLDADLGFGSSSPVVTSDGGVDGSPVLWGVRTAGGSGNGAELRAWQALPGPDGVLRRVGSWPLPRAAKFATPTAAAGRVFIGTRDGTDDDPAVVGGSADGQVVAFGSAAPVRVSSTTFGPVEDGTISTRRVTVTALRATAVTAVTAVGDGFALAGSPALPVDLPAGGRLDVPVSFQPTRPGRQAGTLLVTAAGATTGGALSGLAQARGPRPSAPPQVELGMLAAGGVQVVTLVLGNDGDEPFRVTAAAQVAGDGAVSIASGPDAGTELLPQRSVPVSVRFAPQAPGDTAATLSLPTSAGTVVVRLRGACRAPGRLVVLPAVLDAGAVPVGTTVHLHATLLNDGGLPLHLYRSKRPSGGAGFTAVAGPDEAGVLAPGAPASLDVDWTPPRAGAASDVWALTTEDGPHDVVLRGTGVVAPPVSGPPAPGPPAAGPRRPPSRPHHLRAARLDSGVRLTWQAGAAGSAAPDGYVVRLTPGRRRWALPARSRSLVLRGLPRGQVLHVVITALSRDGASGAARLDLRARRGTIVAR